MTHNFFIGDLGFHKLLNDEHPYERATAPFRKEQFDAAPTVGDQSLSGWWTRGQLSFHRGAGVKYYEVLDGETVLDRFADSNGVKWRNPGEVELQEDHYKQVSQTWIDAANTGDGPWIYDPPIDAGVYTFFIDWNASTNQMYYYTSASPASPATPTAFALTGAPDIMAKGEGNIIWVATRSKSIERITSKSTSTVAPTADGVYYTHTQYIAGLWWAKGRLWVLDQDGKIFTVSGSPATPPEALPATEDSSLREVVNWPGYATLTETPGAVYLATGTNRVWRVSVDESTTVPTLGAAVVSAELPAQEWLYAIKAHLGHVLLVSGSGRVRAALMNQDGSLTYGPSLLQMGGSTWCRSIAASDTSLFFTGPGLSQTSSAGSATLYEVNLAEVKSGELDFAWAPVLTFSATSAGSPTGVTSARVDGWGFKVWDHAQLVTACVPSSSTSAVDIDRIETGTVETGLHRFGTLDNKHFHEVLVRSEGSGTIEVWKIDEAGVETQLTSLAGLTYLPPSTTDDDERTFPLGGAAPSERIALKFVLKRDTVDVDLGPTFTGYQIKALPSPKRQRLVRVPLMMFDIERGPTGRSIGSEKDAWTRIQALEALEESNAVVTYEDKDTGETGTGFIESVEMMQRNGSKGNSRSNGFGGVLTITLRKVA